MILVRNGYNGWLARMRTEARLACRELRSERGSSAALGQATQQELDDWIRVNHSEEYAKREIEYEKIEASLKFLREQLEEIDNKRVQYKAVISNRQERVIS